MKGVVHAISKLRDVYSCVKVDKVSPMIKGLESKQARDILLQSLYNDRLGSRVTLDAMNDTLVF